MANPSIRFSSADTHWNTPGHVYRALNHEFRFTLDACRTRHGLLTSWSGQRVFCNPSGGRGIPEWLAKEHDAELAVFLLPARTDTKWFHNHCLARAQEVRFLRSRLQLVGGEKDGSPSPFPSMIVVYRKV